MKILNAKFTGYVDRVSLNPLISAGLGHGVPAELCYHLFDLGHRRDSSFVGAFIHFLFINALNIVIQGVADRAAWGARPPSARTPGGSPGTIPWWSCCCGQVPHPAGTCNGA
jgi:hypothetical protein